MARPKPSVRVLISVADHHKTADVWADPYKRGMLVEIWRKAGDKFAGRNGDRVPLRPTDRMEVAGKYDPTEADAAVEGLLREVGYRLDRYPNRWVVTVRNFAKRNGFGEPKPDAVNQSPRPGTSASESDSDSESESESEEKKDPPSASRSRTSSVKSPKPESLEGEARAEVEAWAKRKGYPPAILNAGLERFREWEPLKQANRTPKQWAAAFKRIVREGVESGAIVADPQRKPRGQAYEDADGLLRRRREEFERESSRASEDPEAVGKIIDLALTGGAS